MDNSKDFYIRDNTLLKYLGKDKHVVIPDTVNKIASNNLYS